MLAGGVGLACVPPLPNNSPDRAWPESAPPLGMPSTLVEWGVMRLLLSFLRRDAARVHIILTYHRQRRCPVAWTLLVVTIPLNHHLGLFSFTCTRGRSMGVRAHHHLTSRSTRLAFKSVARCSPWSSCKRKTGCSSNIWLDCLLQSVCCLPASPALSSRWPGALTLACPSDYRLRKGPILPDGGDRPARSLSRCPN